MGIRRTRKPVRSYCAHPVKEGTHAENRGLEHLPCPAHTDEHYCTDNNEINDYLRILHNDLRAGVAGTQEEIDRHLFAAGPCISVRVPVALFVLPRASIVRFETLPNIQDRITRVLMITDSDTSTMAQFLRQCIPLKRRTKRAQRDIVWRDDDVRDMRIVLRCAFGLFFGLYPTCSKFAHFHNRVAINALLHALLCAPAGVITSFCNSLSYTLRISMMEHCCYTITQFSPGLARSLNQKKQFQPFCTSIYSVGDTYRAEMNKVALPAHNKSGVWQMLQAMESTAQTLFDRCSRAYRTVISPPQAVTISSACRRSIMQWVKGSPQDLVRVLSAHVCPNKYLFALVNENLVPSFITDEAWQLVNNVRIGILSAQVTLYQLARVYEMHPNDIPLRQRQGVLQVCVLCALKNGYHTHPCATRYNAVKRLLTCVECEQASIMQVNLVGRVLYIGSRAIVLSRCCLTPIIWTGSGDEWSAMCGPHCQRNGFQSVCSKRKKAQTSSDKNSVAQCLLCSSKITTHTRTVLNMRIKRVEAVHFCSKHHPPVALLNNVTDIQEIEEFFDPSLAFMQLHAHEPLGAPSRYQC